MDLSIHPFTNSDSDYQALAALRNALYPDYPSTAAEWRRRDERRDSKCILVRVIATLHGHVVGMGHYAQLTWMFHPQKFDFGVHVHSDFQRQGVGARIYDHLMADLAPHEPINLRCSVREDSVASLRWAARHGFVEDMRFWESRLDVVAFDPARFAGHVEQVASQGVAIFSLAELEARDPDFWKRYYDLDIETSKDVPTPEPQTQLDYAEWRKWFTGPSFLPDGQFIAVADGQYVGLSALWRHEGMADLDTGLTAVRREYRRRGIALALKLHAIDYAQRMGAPVIRTDNELNNRPMLSINEALGFVKQPAWIALVNRLREE